MSRRSPAVVLVHIVWATRRRRALLPPAFDATLLAMLGDNARRLDSSLLAAGCADDHVHVVVRVSPTAALADLVRQLKGASSHDISARALLPAGFSWQDGYWAESLGPDDFGRLAPYVRAQRRRHDDSHPAERWQFDDDREAALGSPSHELRTGRPGSIYGEAHPTNPGLEEAVSKPGGPRKIDPGLEVRGR